ncbi:MAG: RNA polymerase sigma factor [Thermoleophilia bacterium]|nr:RNA polymerase sigma factor [Thermoleophilia bacterium]
MSAVESLPAGRHKTCAERPSFAAVAAAHLDDVYRYLVYMTRDGNVAEDLTADTFERALRNWHRFDARRAGARTWLCQLARSTALDHFRAEERRRRREDRYARETTPADGESALPGLSPALERALAELSAAEREVIVLRIVLELDGDAAANVLGISRTACSTRLGRALQRLEQKVSADALA